MLLLLCMCMVFMLLVVLGFCDVRRAGSCVGVVCVCVVVDVCGDGVDNTGCGVSDVVVWCCGCC